MSLPSGLLIAVAALAAAAAAFGAEELQRTVHFAGAPAGAWDSARDEARLNREYSRFTLSQGEGAAIWRFATKDPAFADIFLRRPIEDAFSALALRVRNAGAPLRLAVKLADANGAEWTVPAVDLPAGGEWQEVRFPWEKFAVASWSKDANGRFDWPSGVMAVIAFGVEKGKEYELHLAEVAMLNVPPVRVRAQVTGMPAAVDAGGAFEVRATLTPEAEYRAAPDAEVRLVREGAVVVRVPVTLPAAPWKAGAPVALGPVRLELPRFAWGGDYQVRLAIPSALVSAAGQPDGVLAAVKVRPRRAGRTVAEVRPHNGVPTLFLNGRPDAAMSYMTYRPTAKHFRQFGEAGVHLHTFSSTPTEAGYGLAREAWVAPDRFDYAQAHERILMVLENDPDGYFFPRLYLRAPKWWTDAHPDEVVTHDPGDGKPVPFLHSEGRQVPSWASEAWRRDTAEGLRRYIRHMEESPWADRVIGYHLASGTTEEWMQWGGNENQWTDYSRPNREKFRAWLKAKYATEAALRAAWADPAVTFATAAIPTRKQREASALFTLHEPAAAQAVIDYTLYTSDLVADTIAYFARVVKEATRREKLVGAFYGYVLQLAGEQRQQNAGHLALDKVLACPDLDFMTSPTSYAFRAPGTGYSHFMSLTDSVRAHGKLWMDENDIRTWLLGGESTGWGQTPTYEETLLQQQREFANVMATGCGQWWFDMSSGWYDDPRLMNDIAGMRAIADQSVAWDRSPVHQVALVVDPRSLAWLRTANFLSRPLLMDQLPQLGRMGAPFGSYLLDDLERIPPHRMYVFASCFAPTKAQRAAIERVVKKDGRVAVWLYAPGIYRNGRLDEAGMQALTGIHLRLAREETPLIVKVAGDDPLLAGLGEARYGTDRPVGPVVHADDPEVKVLGRLPDGTRAGLVVRRFPGWTSVFSAAPVLPAGLLRNLARSAGVHLYTEGDEVVYANRGILAVNVNAGGPRTLHLPRPARVTELFTGKVLGDKVQQFTADIPAKGTALYHVE